MNEQEKHVDDDERAHEDQQLAHPEKLPGSAGRRKDQLPSATAMAVGLWRCPNNCELAFSSSAAVSPGCTPHGAPPRRPTFCSSRSARCSTAPPHTRRAASPRHSG